ncbi:hypothetical protein QTO34_017977 [Cnephaeus nilssonii]|uniref:Uncharacterized protein n=1 Tax=Cnephaeus nilssonii TaxID=3371016 RepID=A0AA40I301_CNENI|nr:hypothetical protein QTO34_017977 [Eptesicus nilssonii]
MSKGARVLGAATAGVFLLMDVVDLVKESKHLHEGAKAESAEELRQQAQELERRLEELTRIHESLQEDLTPPPFQLFRQETVFTEATDTAMTTRDGLLGQVAEIPRH